MLNQRETNYNNFDELSRLRLQGFTQEALTILARRLTTVKGNLSQEDREPSDVRQYSYLLSETTNNLQNTLNPDIILNSRELVGSSVFTWDNEDGTVQEDKLIACDLTTYTVSRSKIINKTNINGGYTTVKEFTGQSDFDIVIEGTFYNDVPDLIPIRSVERLIEMCNYNGRIDITNEFLNEACGIFKFILDDYTLDESSIGNIQSFTLRGVSDLP